MNASLNTSGPDRDPVGVSTSPSSLQTAGSLDETVRVVRLLGTEINTETVPKDQHGALLSTGGFWHIGVMNVVTIEGIACITMNGGVEDFQFIPITQVSKIIYRIGTVMPHPLTWSFMEDVVTVFLPAATLDAMRKKGNMIPMSWKKISMPMIVSYKGERVALKTRDGNWKLGMIDFYHYENVPHVMMNGIKGGGSSRSIEFIDIAKLLFHKK